MSNHSNMLTVTFCEENLHVLKRKDNFQVCTSERVAMELADRTVGLLLTVTSLSIFIYYTFWVIILPLVDTDHFVHKYFLPQEYAILVPVFAGMALICLLSMFIGYVMLKAKKKA
ncbi:Dolichol phosphate-mannose biosynthesis regulatory protein [Datura stramonium]|uniref:Dolichol phosphate-mannose biosynthesis regulatory protein n=1 Tax=Datura stramonium TaxID=4076 RepID=A0ABS8TIA5_DATST|nr:Dolichol phosphate-mannose biosynthesis regulatory protein [Datura stramonium]